MDSAEDLSMKEIQPIEPTDFAKSGLHFSINLYKQCIIGNTDNLFLSPLSISAALAMTFAGAKNATAEEMKKVLKFDVIGDDPEVHNAFQGGVNALLELNNPSINLHLANRMYVHHKTSLLPQFVSILEKCYRATASQVNFVQERELARQEINRWVEEQTRDKIKDLLAPGILTEDTRLVLVNAIYFKGDWANKFDPCNTVPREFSVNENEKITVDMMYTKKKFRYSQNHELNFQMLELPYINETLSLFLVLPNDPLGLSDLEDQLSFDLINDTTKVMRKQDVKVFLPKFKMESTLSLSEILQAMGMKQLFSNKSADLSGITGERDLVVSAVVHKAFLEVNEEGSEAAAATAVVMQLRCCAVMEPRFNADHPFLLFIRDNKTGCILFWGRVTKPTASSQAG